MRIVRRRSGRACAISRNSPRVRAASANGETKHWIRAGRFCLRPLPWTAGCARAIAVSGRGRRRCRGTSASPKTPPPPRICRLSPPTLSPPPCAWCRWARPPACAFWRRWSHHSSHCRRNENGYARRSRRLRLPLRPRRHAARNPIHKAVPLMSTSPHGPLRVGVGGPVGTGKTALMDALCKTLPRSTTTSRPSPTTSTPRRTPNS